MPDPFVLITGAWHGGWAWRPVAEHLRAAGRAVYAPTLPGLADGDDPTQYSLADTVQAVVDLIEGEDLHDVTLVGHSWGGYPITGAAPAIAARLRKLVYWSAFVPAVRAVAVTTRYPRRIRNCSPRSPRLPARTRSRCRSRCGRARS
jgi:pimeloyl-ACP methyl ester carboxylesterase